jgi:hypothetical protein
MSIYTYRTWLITHPNGDSHQTWASLFGLMLSARARDGFDAESLDTLTRFRIGGDGSYMPYSAQEK